MRNVLKHSQERLKGVLSVGQPFPVDLDVKSSVAFDKLHLEKNWHASLRRKHVGHNRILVQIGVAMGLERSVLYVLLAASAKIFHAEDVVTQSLVNAPRSTPPEAQRFNFKEIFSCYQHLVAFIKIG